MRLVFPVLLSALLLLVLLAACSPPPLPPEDALTLQNTSRLEPLVDQPFVYRNASFTNATKATCKGTDCAEQTDYRERAARLVYVHDVIIQDALKGMIDASERISEGLTRYKQAKTQALRLQVEQGFTDMRRQCRILDQALDELANATEREPYWEYAGLDINPLQERKAIIADSIEEPCAQTEKAMHDIEVWKSTGQSGLPSYLYT